MKTATAHSRPKRLLSLLAALAMMASLAVVNAAPAFASADGFARLTAGINVLPGADTPYAITVETQEQAVNAVVIGVPQGIGLTIPDETQQELDQDGFTGKVVDLGNGRQRIQFTGGEIPANSALTFDFLADVAAPTTAEQSSGTFFVSLSSDGGESFAQAQEGSSDPIFGDGTLTTTIRFLEVLKVFTRLPVGAQDDTGTEGQTVQVIADVFNYAQSDLSVSTSLNASSDGDNGFVSDDNVITKLGTRTIPANDRRWFVFDVELGTALQDGEPADRPVAFAASPVADASGAAGFGNSLDFLVEIRSELSLIGETFEPRFAAPLADQAFEVDANTSGTPDFTLDAASISFGTTTATLDTTPTYTPGDAPSLTYTGTVADTDGVFPVSYSYTATDDNDFTYTISDVALTESDSGLLGTGFDSSEENVTVTIDGGIPVIGNIAIELPDDADGRPQTEAKDGDSITVSGTVSDDISDAIVNEVSLATAGGLDVATAGEDRITNNSDGTWEVTFSGSEVAFGSQLGTFNATATAIDTAGNVGINSSSFVGFDNETPRLKFAQVESTTSLDLDGVGSLLTGEDPGVISTRFTELGRIKGGCDPTLWEVDGQNIVREVRYTDGSMCQPGGESDDNERVLILTTPLEDGATPLVRYTPAAGDRVGDRAGNLAPEDTVTAVNGVLPEIPGLDQVYRNTTTNPEDCQVEDSPCEVAYRDTSTTFSGSSDGTDDTSTYWTRFTGNDTVVCLQGARSDYEVEVVEVDDDGNVVAVQSKVDAADTNPCVRVDIGSTDGIQTFGLRYVNDAGSGEELLVDLGLDTAAPTFSSFTEDSGDVTVTFDDFLIAGSNNAIDWSVQQRTADGSTTDNPPADVSTPCDSFGSCNTQQRILDANLEEDGAQEDPNNGLLAFDYFLNMGVRYEDRGGNLLDDFHVDAR